MAGAGRSAEAVEREIDDAFSRREDRGASGRINSLSYCRDAVLSAWERRAETAVGRGSVRQIEEPDVAKALDALELALQAVIGRRPDLTEPLETALRAVARLKESGKGAGETKISLARLDKKLAASLLEALPESERADIESRAGRLVEAARDRMDPSTAEKTARALIRRTVRERLGLPRLTLLP